MEASLGSYLREGREAAGITIEEMAQRTRIPRVSIEALEEERFEDLPQTVFVKGFVRACCAESGLDPEPALARLISQAEAEKENAPLLPVERERSLYLSPVSLDVQKGLRISHVLLVLVAVAILVAAYLLAAPEEGAAGASAAATGSDVVPAAVQPAPGGQRDSGAHGGAL